MQKSILSRKAEIKFLIIVFIIAVIVRLIYIDTSYFFWDETVYLMHGKLFAGQQVGYEQVFVRPPLLPSILLIPSLFEDYALLARIIVIILNSLIVFPLFYLGKYINQKTAIFSTLLITFLPIHIINSRWIMTDAPGALLGLLTLLSFFKWVKEEKAIFAYLGAVFMALSILMKFTNLLLFALILPLILLNIKKIKELTISAVFFIITLAPFLLYNLFNYNNPFYIFSRALHVVFTNDSASTNFIWFIFKDSFGLIFIFLIIAGLLLFLHDLIKKKTPIKKKAIDFYFAYCFIFILIYFIYIISKGVAKPPGIEWEVQRFLLLLVPFSLLFCGYPLSYISFRNKKIWIFTGLIILIIGLIPLSEQFVRAYTPAIEFENGLRYITKEFGLYLKDTEINNLACYGNCPPIAYYSNKKIDSYYNKEDLFNSDHQYYIIFGESEDYEFSYAPINKICKKCCCVSLIEKIQ